MAIHPAPPRAAAAGTDWGLLARCALAEWVLVQAVVLGAFVGLLWPPAGWVQRALAAVGIALALKGAS